MRTILGVGLLACVSTLSAAEEIGEVASVTGLWCRDAQRGLNSGDPVFSEDRISYCDPALLKSHSISIQFHKPKVYKRTYKCETPGVCQEGATLWLSDPVGLPGTRLIGRPPVLGNLGSFKNPPGSLIVPDTMTYTGKVNWVALASGHSDLVVCRWSAAKLSDCVSALAQPSTETGIYALVAPNEMVTGVLAVVNDIATASNGWSVYPNSGNPAELSSSSHASILKLYLAEQGVGRGTEAVGKVSSKGITGAQNATDHLPSDKSRSPAAPSKASPAATQK
jgi:hypothetical protein